MICWIYILWRVWLKKLCFFFLLINQDNLSLFRKTLGPHFVSSLRKVFHRDEGQIRVSAEKGLWWENVCCASGVSVRVRRSRDFFAICGNSSHYALSWLFPENLRKRSDLKGKKKECESGRRRLFQMKELNFKHTWKQICHNRIQLSRNGKEVVGSAIKVFDVFLHRPGSILISREENLLKIITVELM